MTSRQQSPGSEYEGTWRTSSLLQERIEPREDGHVGSHVGDLTPGQTSQSCPTLPLELEHLIIGHLYGNAAALKAAALVCKDWINTTRRYLFRTVELTDVHRLLRFTADVPLMPGIRDNVQVLVLRGKAGHSMAVPQPLPTYVNFIVDTTVASIPTLRDLHFVDVSMRFKSFAISPPLRSSLRSLAFKLKDCSPEDFQCMLNIVGLFSSIESLKLTISDTTNVQSVPSPESLLRAGALPSYGSVELRSLQISGLDHHWLPLLLCTLGHVDALRNAALEVDLWHPMMRKTDADAVTEACLLLDACGAFFRGLGPAVRALDVDILYAAAIVHEELSGDWSALGLSACTNLQWLTLYLDVPSTFDGARATLTTALDAYAEIFSACRFPALQYVVVHVLADGADGSSLICDLDWTLLVSAVLALPALETFVLYMRCSLPRPPMVGRYLKDLVRLRRAGKFLFLFATISSLEKNREDVA